MFANLPTNYIDDGDLSWEDENVVGHIQELLHSPWYTDDDGALYIVADEIEGPDNEMADKIARVCSQYPGDRDVEYGLDDFVDGIGYIPPTLRRFNVVDGFYHA